MPLWPRDEPAVTLSPNPAASQDPFRTAWTNRRRNTGRTSYRGSNRRRNRDSTRGSNRRYKAPQDSAQAGTLIVTPSIPRTGGTTGVQAALKGASSSLAPGPRHGSLAPLPALAAAQGPPAGLHAGHSQGGTGHEAEYWEEKGDDKRGWKAGDIQARRKAVEGSRGALREVLPS